MTSDVQVYSAGNLLIHPLVIWNLALIHLERYLSIVHPLRYMYTLYSKVFMHKLIIYR